MGSFVLDPSSLQLLLLPFDQGEVLPNDLTVRGVIKAVYRLIKAMTVGCNRMQLALIPWLPTFVKHTEAYLMDHDISATGVINAVFKDNRTACSQVDESTVRRFVCV